MPRSFIKNGKERKECCVLLKRTDSQPWWHLNTRTVSLKLLAKLETNGYSGQAIPIRVSCATEVSEVTQDVG